VFLKVIQWFLADFVLDDLPVHESVHSFAVSRSIVTNAYPHVQRKFVGNCDIENFFGSVTESRIVQHLIRNSFIPFEAVSIAKICTNHGVLPQGAPTSPVISNSILFSIDSALRAFCDANDMHYTRYADDVTVSDNDRKLVARAFQEFGRLLAGIDLKLNADKTRIAGAAGQQRVAGVVVNSGAVPSRAYRRRARAMFHNASEEPSENFAKISELAGILGFLKMFPRLRETAEIAHYANVLSALESAKQIQG
jgi:hypothetical protein